MVAFSAIAIAGIFHLGVLGLAGGYAIALLFYSREETRFVFSISSLLPGLPIILTVAFVMLRYPELFLEKLDRVSTTEDAIAIATSTTAGSAYLSDFNLDNPILVFLFGWVKGLYLLTSPLPMDWRGLGDIVSFTLDGAFYLLGILVVVWAYSGSEKSVRRRMLAVLLVGVLSAVLVLGLGTKAAGTAMRHRQKLLPAIAVVVAFALSVRQERKRTLKGFPSLSNRTTRGEAESGEAVGRREQ